MTNTQLYIAIIVPLVFNGGVMAVLVLYLNARFEAVTQRLSAIESRLERIEKKLDDHAERIARMEGQMPRAR